MGKYRKVDPYIWNDHKFRSMTTQGQLAFFFLLTHPHMTSLGAMRATIPGLVSELPKVSEKAFREAFAKGMAIADEEACFLWLPKFLNYNPPESPKVVIAWCKAFQLLPECELKNQLILHVKDFLKGYSIGFQEAYAKGMPKTMPYQEQEQEQDIKDSLSQISNEITDEERLVEYLKNWILKNNPDHVFRGKHENWVADMEKIIRLDNRKVCQIRDVIRFSQKDEFWMTNILSPGKLRKQYDQLVLKMKNNGQKNDSCQDAIPEPMTPASVDQLMRDPD